MDHGLESISPILEILEIEVFNILYNTGNIGKLICLFFYYPGNIGKLNFPIFSRTILEIYGRLIFHISSYPGNIETLFWDDPYLKAPCCLGHLRENPFWNMFLKK